MAEFGGPYYQWRLKRVAAVIEHYGAAWFRDKRVLDLGAGHGEIGAFFIALGADVMFVEGRPEHVAEIRARYPDYPSELVIQHNLEHPLPLLAGFDLSISFGVMYHLKEWRQHLRELSIVAQKLVIETEVCDSDDPKLELFTREAGFDQALSGTGTRPSAPMIENEMAKVGYRFQRLTDNRCNSYFHHYDWPVTNSGKWRDGLRRFWFCER